MKTERRNNGRTQVKTADKRAPTDQHHATTPDSATSLEKERLDDDAVEKAVTVDQTQADPKSVLPCPPIPPNKQRKIREGMATGKDTPSERKARRKASG